MRGTVVLTTVSSDSHTWNLVYLELLLREQGYEVLNLGPCVPDEVVLGAVRDARPVAVVVSSVNGHGSLDGARLMRRLAADPLTFTVPTVIGGKLGIAGRLSIEAETDLRAAGFHSVLESPQRLIEVLAELVSARVTQPLAS